MVVMVANRASFLQKSLVLALESSFKVSKIMRDAKAVLENVARLVMLLAVISEKSCTG